MVLKFSQLAGTFEKISQPGEKDDEHFFEE